MTRHIRRAKIVLLASAKGGTTKTTSAVHIAYGLARFGFRVLLVDSDRQASSYRWYEQLTPADGSPSPAGFLVHRQTDPKMLRTEVVAFRDQYDFIVIDTPAITGTEGGALVGRAAGLADHVIVPTAPAGTETGTVDDSLRFIVQVNEMRESAGMGTSDVRILLTRMDYRTTAAKTGREALALHDVTVMTAEIPTRTEILTSFGQIPNPEFYEPVILELFGDDLAARAAEGADEGHGDGSGDDAQ